VDASARVKCWELTFFFFRWHYLFKTTAMPDTKERKKKSKYFFLTPLKILR
jgi:hypothetical protein